MDTASQTNAIAYVGPGCQCAAWAAAGVYLPSFDPGHGAHELTLQIRQSKFSRRHDRDLADLLTAALATDLSGFTPDLVVSIPCRPGQEDRFRHIRRVLATRAGAADGEATLTQTRVVEGYRQMPPGERRAWCPGRFAAQAGVRGRNVLVIDDVITTGAPRQPKLSARSTQPERASSRSSRSPGRPAPHALGPPSRPCPGGRERGLVG